MAGSWGPFINWSEKKIGKFKPILIRLYKLYGNLGCCSEYRYRRVLLIYVTDAKHWNYFISTQCFIGFNRALPNCVQYAVINKEEDGSG